MASFIKIALCWSTHVLQGVKKPDQQPLLDSLPKIIPAAQQPPSASSASQPALSPNAAGAFTASSAAHSSALLPGSGAQASASAAAASAATMLASAANREAMIARATALGRGAMAQSGRKRDNQGRWCPLRGHSDACVFCGGFAL